MSYIPWRLPNLPRQNVIGRASVNVMLENNQHYFSVIEKGQFMDLVESQCRTILTSCHGQVDAIEQEVVIINFQMWDKKAVFPTAS